MVNPRRSGTVRGLLRQAVMNRMVLRAELAPLGAVTAALLLVAPACRDETTTGLGDAALRDDGAIADDARADVGPDARSPDAAEPDAGRDAAAPDAGPPCEPDGPLIFEYLEEAPAGYAADCMPAVPPDPTSMALDFVQLSNLMGMRITGVDFTDFEIVDPTTGVVIQRIEVDTFVPFPTSFEPGEAWGSVLTKTGGDEVGSEVCGYCGDEVALRIRIVSDNQGCFFEQVGIGAMRCTF